MMSRETLTRISLVVASGLALALAFPKFDFSLLAWVAFVPLLYAIGDRNLRAVFGFSWLQGLVFGLVGMYWVVITLHNFAGAPIAVAVIPMILLAAVEALYTAVAIVCAEYSARRLRIPLFFTLPIAWVAFEWLRSFFPIGFPWNLLGYAAYHNTQLIQFAEFTGVYGISALVMFFNAVIFSVISAGRAHRREIWGLSTLTAAMLGAVAFGAFRINSLEHMMPKGSMRIAMVQGNIPQSIKWDPAFLPVSFKVYQEQSEIAAHEKADLIIWPEAAAAFLFQPDDRYPQWAATDAEYRGKLLEFAKTLDEPILFGAPAMKVEQGRIVPSNRAYLVSPQGQVESWYDKIQLVPFGEYVPLRPLLGYFVNKIVVGMGDFVPGREQTLFDVKGAKLGVLICYESVFPDLTRRAANRGADVLVNITNDAWYGDSSAPYQLLTMAAMRAVETHTPMVRVANTGISAVIDPAGRILSRTDLFTRSTEVQTVSWDGNRTFYARFGDIFAETCAALTVLGLSLARFFPRKQKPLEAFAEDLISRNGHRAAQ